MTREKYESLPLATLKELAKARKMRGVSTLKKGDLIDAMLELDEQEEQKEAAEEAREEVKEEKKKRQILNSWTVVLQQTESLRCFRMDMDSFVLTIIFREMEMSMLLLHRFADSDLKQAIS